MALFGRLKKLLALARATQNVQPSIRAAVVAVGEQRPAQPSQGMG